MPKRIGITTVDNPYNPLTDWNEWFAYDIQKGYNTCERIAATSTLSDSLSAKENNETLVETAELLMKTGAIAKDGSIVEYKIVEGGDNSPE